MGRSRKDDKALRDRWLERYRAHRTSMYDTCKEVGVDFKTVREWVDIFPEFSISKKEIEDEVASRVEDRLIDTALDPQKPSNLAQIYYLKHNTEKYAENPVLMPNATIENIWFNKRNEPKQIEKGEG